MILIASFLPILRKIYEEQRYIDSKLNLSLYHEKLSLSLKDDFGSFFPFLLEALEASTVFNTNFVTNSGFEISLNFFSISRSSGPPGKIPSAFSSKRRPVDGGREQDGKNGGCETVPEINRFPEIVDPNNLTELKYSMI